MQQHDPHFWAIVAIVIVVVAVVLAIKTAIAAVIGWFCYRDLRDLPLAYRPCEPWVAWLLLIPCVDLVIVWLVVYHYLPTGYQRFFADHWEGNEDVGDCQQRLGLWTSVCQTAAIIPYLGVLFALAGLVLLIVFLVQMGDLHRRMLAIVAAEAAREQAPPLA